jgi:hypothetical protein
MARLIVRKKPLTAKERNDRAGKYRLTRSFVWIDPFPEVPGTKPEKMVYSELIKRGVPFRFQEWLHIVLPDYDLEGNDWYKPDFILPDLKIIIEVQGAYWHTKADQIESDSYKYALYSLMGFKLLLWWDYDIESSLIELFNKEPELFYRKSPISVVSRSDQQEHADGKAKNGARLSRRKPWTKDPVRIKLRKRRKTRK